MQRNSLFLLGLALVSTASQASDRSIAVPPTLAMSWGYVIPGTQVNPHRAMAVGFWQRSSGAKPGVGALFVSMIEYQLPEAAPARVRSATFQFSGKNSQCVGAEPVVIDIYAYVADGRSEVADASAGTRIAQMSANCTDNPAFARTIDVTAIVRQLSVPAGIRHVGFNIRKANNRQGPGLFGLTAGKLSIVLADEALALAPMPASAGMPAQPAAVLPVNQALPGAGSGALNMPPTAAGVPPAEATAQQALFKALGALARGGKANNEQAVGDLLDGLSKLPASKPASAPGAANSALTQQARQ